MKVFHNGRKHCWKRIYCLSRAIYPFPTVFLKDLYCRLIKTSQGLVWERVKGNILIFPPHSSVKKKQTSGTKRWKMKNLLWLMKGLSLQKIYACFIFFSIVVEEAWKYTNPMGEDYFSTIQSWISVIFMKEGCKKHHVQRKNADNQHFLLPQCFLPLPKVNFISPVPLNFAFLVWIFFEFGDSYILWSDRGLSSGIIAFDNMSCQSRYLVLFLAVTFIIIGYRGKWIGFESYPRKLIQTLKPLSDDKILDWSKLKQIADNILKCI